MKFKKLFETGKMGKMEIRNRIVQVPMVLNYTQYPYNLTKRYIEALAERARGGVGLIITTSTKAESTIDPYPVGTMFPSLDREYTLRTFAELTDTVHMLGAKIGVQLSPGTGRHADVPMADKWPVSASAVPMVFYPKLLTRELNLDEIARLVEAYGEAARRAEQAGFDVIMVHCFGGYLIDQFLTSLWNKRKDKYGGDLENRMRFMVECVESAKSKLSTDFPLIARLSSNHMMEGGRPIDETIKIAKRLEELGISALHLSTGCYDTVQWTVPPMYYPEGVGVPYAQPIKEAISIPIIVEGRIASPEFAEKLLEENKTDFIGLGRSLLADPWWPRKVKEGRTEEIRKCIFCNECGATLAAFRYVKCAVNPALGNEGEHKILPAPRSKRVVVIGGGPAGLKAASIAAVRGHDVTLFEKTNELGGNLKAASAPPFKATIRSLIDWLVREASRAGVKIQLGNEATAKTIKDLKPEVVVFAAGSSPIVTKVLGVGGKNVVTAVDVLLGKAKVGNKLVVVGGGAIGCEVALHFAQMGKHVTIVEMLPEIGADLARANRLAMSRLLAESKVGLVTNAKLDQITNEGIVATSTDGRKQIFKADTVVLAIGMKANDRLYRELEGKVPELYKIGDALQPRKIINAIHEGDFIGREI